MAFDISALESVASQHSLELATKAITGAATAKLLIDNKAVEVDKDGNPIIRPNGKAVMFAAKVRKRTTPQGKAMDVPFKLVDSHPEAALKYPWVSDEHKAIARKILSGEIPESRMSESSSSMLYVCNR